MTHRHPPRLALALLGLLPDSEPLAGDLVEQFDAHPSPVRFWVQVAGALVTAAWGGRSSEIRPLRLVDLQPADAVERWRRLSLRFPAVNLSGSPVAGVGGLALVTLVCLMTGVVPTAWWVLFGSAIAGVALGVVMIVVRAGSAGTRVHG